MSTQIETDVSDPVEYFLQDLTYHGKAERTIEAYQRVLRRFERFLGDRDSAPRTATQRDCMAFVHSLRDSHAESTVASYASYVHRFYTYMTQTGTIESNPMTLVLSEMAETINTDPTRREIDIEEMRTFVSRITHPLERVVVLLLLKTGMRVGECCNLDLRDLNLSVDLPTVRDESPYTHRPQLNGRPDSIFVSGDITRGDEVNGELRTASNKRTRVTIVPVDGELREALLPWLAIRPDSPSPALFVDTGRKWGRRLEPSQIRTFVRRHAEAMEWYRVGGGAEENVTPHYFRHFFTTYLRDRTGDRGIVKYIRGDVATDIIDTYTHEWGNRVRSVYESSIYSLV